MVRIRKATTTGCCIALICVATIKNMHENTKNIQLHMVQDKAIEGRNEQAPVLGENVPETTISTSDSTRSRDSTLEQQGNDDDDDDDDGDVGIGIGIGIGDVNDSTDDVAKEDGKVDGNEDVQDDIHIIDSSTKTEDGKDTPFIHEKEEEDNEQKQDNFCVIHVGPHKTGSTSLQDFILESSPSKSALKKDNYKVPHFPIGMGRAVHEPGKNHAIIANCFRSQKSRNFCPNGRVRNRNLEYFQSFVKDAATTSSNIALTSEEFDPMDMNVTELVGYLTAHDYKVHVVVYYRRFYDWLISWYNQLTKTGWNKNYVTFEQWCTLTKLEEFRRAHSNAVYNLYNIPGIYNVSVINMHEDPDNYDSNSRFACDHLDNALHSCELAKSKVSIRRNGSEDLTWRIFRHKLEHFQSIRPSSSGWEKIEAKFNEMTDIPLLCLPRDVQERMLHISLEAEIALTPEWWHNGKEGLEHLKADFEEKIESTFCTMDFSTVLGSSEWQSFLAGLQYNSIEE